MNTLVVNAGSTSLKVDVYEMPSEICRLSALVQRIGKTDATIHISVDGESTLDEMTSISDHGAALSRVLDVATTVCTVDAVGHRVVHGGEEISQPMLIDDRIETTIETSARFAPLHNPHNLNAIRAARQRMPSVPHVAVVDTGFHRTLPPESFLYGLPYELYEKHGVRRYGFHGTSHEYVATQAARALNRELDEINQITCHLGGGASVCAIERGTSVHTSMGMTPLEGLLMGTRSGDLDPGVVLFLQSQLSLNQSQIDDLLNRESGLKGVSGISRDMRELLAAEESGHERARLAIDIFCLRVRHYIGAYAAHLGGVDALVFTGGIGENSPIIRERVCSGLSFIGIEIDAEANGKQDRRAPVISKAGGRVTVLAIQTDEELQIAREVVRLTSNSKGK